MSKTDRMQPYSLNINGRIHEFDKPSVMSILNVTPDSFYSDSRATTERDIAKRVESMLRDGATFIDVGAYSTRPGCCDISPDIELERLKLALKAVREVSNDVLVSVDTFRANVARIAVEDMGADIINDISGGTIDPEMIPTVAKLRVPYVLMHMRGTPQSMQQHCQYADVTAEVLQELAARIAELNLLGVNDIIIDPGFGFSKTLEQNYELMRNLHIFVEAFHLPVLVGISRKSMITKLLGCTPTDALTGTTALNFYALLHGAAILRVHDTLPAAQLIRLSHEL